MESLFGLGWGDLRIWISAGKTGAIIYSPRAAHLPIASQSTPHGNGRNTREQVETLKTLEALV